MVFFGDLPPRQMYGTGDDRPITVGEHKIMLKEALTLATIPGTEYCPLVMCTSAMSHVSLAGLIGFLMLA